MRKLACIGVFFLTAAQALAALPPDARAVLDSMLGKALALEYVVQVAVKTSDMFRSLRAQKEAAEVPWLQVRAATDPRAYAKVQWLDDQREPQVANPFSPTRITGSSYSLGVTSLFATGTSLNFDITHNLSTVRLPQAGDQNLGETKATLSLSQSLWADAFGTGFRAAKEAGRLSREAGLYGYQEGQEEAFLQIVDLFYSSWLAKTNREAAEQSLKRRERLLQIIELKLRRGTAEPPDRLQMTALKNFAEIQVGQATQALGDRWRQLVVLLKLPEHWISIDPAQIPIRLDTSPQEAVSACGSENQMSPAPGNVLAVQRAELIREAARLNLEKAKSDHRPDLKLSLSLGANAVDSSGATAFSDFFKFNTPLYGTGLTLTVPLGFLSEDAKYRSALSDDIRSEAQASQVKDSLRVQWQSQCLDLFRLVKVRETQAKTVQMQQEREKLEEERFRLGRSNTLQVITAGDDVTQAQLALAQTEMILRQTSWRILRWTGQVRKLLAGFETKEGQG